jgi:hypothetical protein
MTAGDRRLVREAVASYFGGTLQTADAGIYYQGGPLTSAGLGTAYPYLIKGAPDQFYTLGESAGTGWGAILTVRLGQTLISRRKEKGGAMGGATSGFRGRWYTTVCSLQVISYLPHLETAEAAFDDLLDAFLGLIYADRTLGATNAGLYPNPPYFGNRLIMQAGEPDISLGKPDWQVETDRGRAEGGIDITFDVLTMVAA